MRLHFKTSGGDYLNIYTSPDPEGYDLAPTEYRAVEVSTDDYYELLHTLSFYAVDYVGEPIDPPPWH